MRNFVVMGCRDYRVPFKVKVEADCEGDVADERVGVAIAEEISATPEQWDDAEMVGERITSVVEVKRGEG